MIHDRTFNQKAKKQNIMIDANDLRMFATVELTRLKIYFTV